MSLRDRSNRWTHTSARRIVCLLGAIVVSATATGVASAQAPVAPAKPATLWSFLGIPQTYTTVRDNFSNRSGNRPRAERKPPLTRLADPENLKSPNPAIKKAAEIKKEEDLAKQKIKAVKYLTKIGCGCYNRDGSITDALLKALDDCTEDVRYETVKAITDAANGEACANCKNKSCCSEELSNKLYEMAYERDDSGCFLEPSERVREAAAAALRACCPGRGNDEGFIIDETPAGTGTGGEVPEGERPGTINPGTGERPNLPPASPPPPVVPPAVPSPELGPVPTPAPTPARNPEASFNTEENAPTIAPPGQRSSRRTAGMYNNQPKVMQASNSTEIAQPQIVRPELGHDLDPAPAPASVLVPNSVPAEQPQQITARPARPQPQAHSTVEQPSPGVAASVDLRNNQAMINFPQGETVRVGTMLRAYHTYAFTGKQPVGDFQVIQSTPGFAIVRPHGQTKLNKLVSGDQMLVPQQ